MGKSSTSRLLTRTLFQSIYQPPTSLRCAVSFARQLSQSCTRPADQDDAMASLRSAVPRNSNISGQQLGASQAAPPRMSNMEKLENLIDPQSRLTSDILGKVRNQLSIDTSMLDPTASLREDLDDSTMPYHFNIYSHKHDTHVTVSKPNRDVIISLSCGNLGFKKAGRKHYDSAYQLAAYVLDRLTQQGWHKKIQRMEVILRGFGAGREAVTKVLLGNEGRAFRDKIRRVADGTRLKFGGTRSKKPRRLG